MASAAGVSIPSAVLPVIQTREPLIVGDTIPLLQQRTSYNRRPLFVRLFGLLSPLPFLCRGLVDWRAWPFPGPNHRRRKRWAEPGNRCRDGARSVERKINIAAYGCDTGLRVPHPRTNGRSMCTYINPVGVLRLVAHNKPQRSLSKRQRQPYTAR